MVESALLQNTPATALTDVYRTLQPSPLTTPEELKAFYREEINQVSYKQKAERLKQVYDGDKEAQMTDPVLYSLLNARAVQEFNGQRWFGVHPLVVDILAAQKHLPTGAEGGTV